MARIARSQSVPVPEFQGQQPPAPPLVSTPGPQQASSAAGGRGAGFCDLDSPDLSFQTPLLRNASVPVGTTVAQGGAGFCQVATGLPHVMCPAGTGGLVPATSSTSPIAASQIAQQLRAGGWVNPNELKIDLNESARRMRRLSRRLGKVGDEGGGSQDFSLQEKRELRKERSERLRALLEIVESNGKNS